VCLGVYVVVVVVVVMWYVCVQVLELVMICVCDHVHMAHQCDIVQWSMCVCLATDHD